MIRRGLKTYKGTKKCANPKANSHIFRHFLDLISIKKTQRPRRGDLSREMRSKVGQKVPFWGHHSQVFHLADGYFEAI
jgi:hypothetical protein